MNPAPASIAWFLQLNQVAGDSILAPGTIVVVPAAQGMACTVAEINLAANLRGMRPELPNLQGPIEDPETTNLFYDLLELTQSAQTPGGLGAYSLVVKKQIDEITEVLRKLQRHYTHTYERQRNLKGQSFYQGRQQLLHQLDTELRHWIGRGLAGSSETLRIRRKRGISTKRIINRWSKAGTSAGGVPELQSRINRLNHAARAAKGLGYLGIGLDVAWSAVEINRHLEEDRPDRNRRIGGEVGRLVGSVGGGALAGVAGYAACNLVFGVPSGGTSLIWCGIVVGGGGALALGAAGSEFGPTFGSRIYDLSESVAGW